MKIIHSMRVKKGIMNDFVALAWEHYKAHGRESITDAFTEAAADMAIARYQEKIRNGFARAGVPLPDGGLNAQTMQGIVSQQTGLTLDNLSPDAVTRAIDKLLSQRLSQALGVQVATVMDKEAMLASINAAVLQAIRDGRAAEFVNRHAMHAARRYMAFKNAGISEENAAKIANRARQKKFRQTHKLVWL